MYAGLQNRSFVYVLTVDYMDSEHFIYVGKSSAQYARLLNHLAKYQFNYVYLFECEPEQLNKAEASVIQELCPLYNQRHNPLAERNKKLLGIDYQSGKSSEAIQHDLDIQASYNSSCLYGFPSPVPFLK